MNYRGKLLDGSFVMSGLVGKAAAERVGERRGDENDHEQRQRVNKSRNGRATAAADIRGRAGNRARRRYAAEQRAENIRQALRDQFLIGIVPVINHPIRDDGR